MEVEDLRPSDDNVTRAISLVISFRGKKFEQPLAPGTTVRAVKERLLDDYHSVTENEDRGALAGGSPSTTYYVKLFCKGKILSDPDADLHSFLTSQSSAGAGKRRGTMGNNRTVKLMATGISHAEADRNDREFREGVKNAPRIRDDLTERGRMEEARRRQRGRRMLRQAASRTNAAAEVGRERFGFGRIETLPMLPQETTAREILESLANDPGVLACMAKHRWNVGCLAEMYPEGKVGQSEVCVMGLNQNKGQKILLRIRTDDLKGFRKILSIRKVLFHELAHNVHSDHDNDFFQLMRQIERECNEMDWTQGSGESVGGVGRSGDHGEDVFPGDGSYVGGSGRLGGDSGAYSGDRPAREMAARAAMLRLTAEEEEIRQHCGCTLERNRDDGVPSGMVIDRGDGEDDGTANSGSS